jgi:hypothetical protein
MTTKTQDCSFEIIDGVATVLGTQDPGTHEFGDPPAPLKKGEQVSFMGKWPLESYLDNNKEIFTFTTTLGVVVTGTLIGFTVDCKAAYQNKGLGVPRIRIRFATKGDGLAAAV